ncbi:PilZ domain-containing protein [Ideonella sp.]|uniref:PilZ domain-containing protein n=1 Tax=Ideonella sp. TaxID=1929293 RepID=UPI003BB69151
MTDDDLDQRKFPRVEFNLAPEPGEQLPLWVNSAPPPPQGLAGVVLNMSEGGIQVLTGADQPLQAERYAVRLLPDGAGPEDGFTLNAHCNWSSPLSTIGHLHGLEFDDFSARAGQFLADYGLEVAERKWVRCLLTQPH